MIVLEAKSGHTKTREMYPAAMQDRLHGCISRELARDLIDNYDAIECDPFTERNSSLEESYFKKQLKQGAPETVRVAKTMRHRIHVAQSHGKKPSGYYSRVLKEAHRRALEELAVAIGCSEEEIETRMVDTFHQFAPSLN